MWAVDTGGGSNERSPERTMKGDTDYHVTPAADCSPSEFPLCGRVGEQWSLSARRGLTWEQLGMIVGSWRGCAPAGGQAGRREHGGGGGGGGGVERWWGDRIWWSGDVSEKHAKEKGAVTDDPRGSDLWLDWNRKRGWKHFLEYFLEARARAGSRSPGGSSGREHLLLWE